MIINDRVSYISRECYDYLESCIDSIEMFDNYTFNKWLVLNNVEYRSNPSAFVRNAFLDSYKKGAFKYKVPVANIVPLLNAMREKGVVVTAQEIVVIGIMEQHFLKTKLFSKKELIQYNHKALNYIVKKYTKPTGTDFIDVFRKSKLNIDFSYIDEFSKIELEKWKELL